MKYFNFDTKLEEDLLTLNNFVNWYNNVKQKSREVDISYIGKYISEKNRALLQLNQIYEIVSGQEGEYDDLIEFQKKESLDLSGYGIEELPEQIGLMTNLKKLDLSHNCLKTLPESLWELKSLTTLNLSNNKLSNISSKLKDSNISSLNLTENNFKNIDFANVFTNAPSFCQISV